MTKPIDPDDPAIVAGRFLMRQIIEVRAVAEAIRVLLEQRGVFSHDEFEKMCGYAVSKLETSIRDQLTDTQEAATAEMLRRLLEAHKGPIQ